MENELKPYGCSTRLHREISSKEGFIRLGSEEHDLYLTKISLAIKEDTWGIDCQQAYDSMAIFPLSSMIAFGAEPQSSVSKSYCLLRAKGVTHILNLRRKNICLPWLFPKLRGYPNLEHLPISPNYALNKNEILIIVETIHRLLHSTLEPRIYIHCQQGMERAPTALWLYLVSIGFSEEVADTAINNVRRDASPAKVPMVRRNYSVDKIIRELADKLVAFRSGIFKTLYPVEWPV